MSQHFVCSALKEMASFVLSGFLIAILLSPTVANEPDPSCINNRAGLSACNYDFQANPYCGWVSLDGTKNLWKRTEESTPVKVHENYYIYLDGNDSRGKPAGLKSSISIGVEAICGEFFFATNSSVEVPIKIGFRDGKDIQLMHEVTANTNGEWNSTNFSCCLPGNTTRNMEIFLESFVQPGDVVAIDYMNLRQSNMNCSGNELVCYPTPPSLYTTTPLPEAGTTSKPSPLPSCSGPVESGAASCDFNDDLVGSGNCSWEVPSSWNQSLNSDILGGYIYYTGDEHHSLISNVSQDVEAVCVEIQFAPEADSESLRNIFSLHIVDDDQTFLWGEAYAYTDSGARFWKRNSFVGCLGQGTNRQIVLRAHRKGLKIDHIHIRSANKTCSRPDSPIPDHVPDDRSFLSCPSQSQNKPFCGFEVSDNGWKEIKGGNGDVFAGEEYYILYQGSNSDLEEPATLTSVVVDTDKESTLEFSYNMVGPGNLELSAETLDGSIQEVLWSSNHETGGNWTSIVAPISTIGQFKVIFQVAGEEGNSSEILEVGFTGISIVEGTDNGGGKDKNGTDSKGDDNGGGDVKPAKRSGSGGNNAGAIAGAVIGSLIFVALVAGGVFYWLRYKRPGQSMADSRYVKHSVMKDDDPLASPQSIENAMYSA